MSAKRNTHLFIHGFKYNFRDGSIKIWDLRVRDRPTACLQPRTDSERRDAWAVALGGSTDESERSVAAGFDNGDVKLFDLRAMAVKWEEEVAGGICSLQFDRKDIQLNKLVATCLHGQVHAWDLRTHHAKEGFARTDARLKSSSATVWCGRHLPQNRDVLMTTAGGSDGLVLWKYVYPDQRWREDKHGERLGVAGTLKRVQDLELGEQPISSLSWSPDKAGLAACTSFDQKIRTLIVTKTNTL
jgi:WD40 repeat protein